MALKPKIDAKSTYHITLTGEKALIMNAMILMFAGGEKGGAQHVVAELVEDEYKRQKTSIDAFIAGNKEKIDAMLKSDEKRGGNSATKPKLGVVTSDKKAANA